MSLLIGTGRVLVAPLIHRHRYYVDSVYGNDGYSGTQRSKPWQTIARVNAAAAEELVPTALVRFQRDQMWREQLAAPFPGTSGNPITFGAYGSGDKPLFKGSVIETGFVLDAGNVYEKTGYTQSAAACRWVFEDGERLIIAANRGAMVQGSWYLDDGADILYVWSTDDADPDTHTIERPNEWQMINAYGKSFLRYENLRATHSINAGFYYKDDNVSHIETVDCESFFCGSRGFDVGGTWEGVPTHHDITFRNCIAHDNNGEGFWLSGSRVGAVDCTAYNNGKDVLLKGYTMDGGGIIIGAQAIDCYLRRTRVYDVYYGASLWVEWEPESPEYPRPLRTMIEDCYLRGTFGTGHAGRLLIATGQDSIYRNNILIFDGDNSAIYVSDGSTDEAFYHNSVYRTSSPWGDYLLRADDASGLTLRNNAFHCISNNEEIIKIEAGAQAGFDSDNNQFYIVNGDANPYTWGAISYATLVLWAAQSGTDGNSDEADPLYVNPGADDLHLQVGSPCRGEGATDTGVTDDYDGVTRGSPPDIGAYEYVA